MAIQGREKADLLRFGTTAISNSAGSIRGSLGFCRGAKRTARSLHDRGEGRKGRGAVHCEPAHRCQYCLDE
jgi:hypothetical protein